MTIATVRPMVLLLMTLVTITDIATSTASVTGATTVVGIAGTTMQSAVQTVFVCLPIFPSDFSCCCCGSSSSLLLLIRLHYNSGICYYEDDYYCYCYYHCSSSVAFCMSFQVFCRKLLLGSWAGTRPVERSTWQCSCPGRAQVWAVQT